MGVDEINPGLIYSYSIPKDSTLENINIENLTNESVEVTFTRNINDGVGEVKLYEGNIENGTEVANQSSPSYNGDKGTISVTNLNSNTNYNDWYLAIDGNTDDGKGYVYYVPDFKTQNSFWISNLTPSAHNFKVEITNSSKVSSNVVIKLKDEKGNVISDSVTLNSGTNIFLFNEQINNTFALEENANYSLELWKDDSSELFDSLNFKTLYTTDVINANLNILWRKI